MSDIVQHGSIQRVIVGILSSEQCYYAGALHVTKLSRRTTPQTCGIDSGFEFIIWNFRRVAGNTLHYICCVK